MRRGVMVALIVFALGALLFWQWSRERQMAHCLAQGGVWNGPVSRCDEPANRPLIKRNIERG